jgi:SAM-dependent methyltransferase
VRTPTWHPDRYRVTADYLFPASVTAVDALVLPPGSLLLDVATGTGNAAVVALARGFRVIGVDSSPDQLAAARERCPAARFVEGDAAALPLPDDQADGAVSVFGLIFAADPDAALRELVRCVRRGGPVAVTTWTSGDWVSDARELLAAELDVSTPPLPVGWPDAGAASAAARAAGLVGVAVDTGHLRLPADVDVVTRALGGLAGQRELLERTGRWPAARTALADCLARHAVDGQLVETYRVITGRTP